MKRAGFTMIELIFVIVILGILSAVALPKFIGVSEQARTQKVAAFVGTLNRTVGPALWSQSLMGSIGTGKVTTLCNTTALVLTQTEIPDELQVASSNGCAFDANTTAGGKFGINFTDGNTTNAPVWTIATGATAATSN
jgi:prepilin-type N-terminal cleavage/methylation domain-containing protein